MKSNFQLNLTEIKLKRNFDFVDKFDKVLGRSIFKNEIYWCSLIWETVDIDNNSKINFKNPLEEIISPVYAIRLPGREDVKHYKLWPSLNNFNENTEKPNIIRYDQPGKEIWYGDLDSGENVLRYNIWIMESDSGPKNISEINKKFESEINLQNIQMVVDLIKNKVHHTVLMETIISFITRVGAMILKEEHDDLVSAFHGSLIGYNFMKPFTHRLHSYGSDVSLYLDKHSTGGAINEKTASAPGCVLSHFDNSNEDSIYFKKVLKRLRSSIS